MTDDEILSCQEDKRQIERLIALLHRLRAPGGCPWDAEQTHESIVPNLLEEAFELIAAIENKDRINLKEEIGDVLLQALFHSEIASEHAETPFNVYEVARTVCQKLITRHPHVFAGSEVADVEGVLNQWDAIKKRERGEEKSPYLHGVGKGLPPLLRAEKLQKKAAKVGFDWSDEEGAWQKLFEEIEEMRVEKEHNQADALEEEMGDVIFSLVNILRLRKINPLLLVQAANEKFEKRFTAMEKRLLTESNTSLEEANIEAMENAWNASKAEV